MLKYFFSTLTRVGLLNSDSLPPFFGGFCDGTPGLNGRQGSKSINGNRKLSSTYYRSIKKTHRGLLVQVLAEAVSLVAVVTCVCDDTRLKMTEIFFC